MYFLVLLNFEYCAFTHKEVLFTNYVPNFILESFEAFKFTLSQYIKGIALFCNYQYSFQYSSKFKIVLSISTNIVSSKSHIGLYASATLFVKSVFKDYCIVHSYLGGSLTIGHSMSRHFYILIRRILQKHHRKV